MVIEKNADLRWFFFIFIALFSFLSGAILQDTTNMTMPYIKLYLFILIFCVGSQTSLSKLLEMIKNRKRLIVLVIALRLVCVPLIGYFYSVILGLTTEFFIGMIYLSIVPSAMIAAVFSVMFNGDVRLNVIATFFMMLLAPITIPLLSFVYLDKITEINILNTFYSLLVNLLFPLLIGILSHRFFNDVKSYKKIRDAVMFLSVGLIIFSIMGRSQNLLFSPKILNLVLVITCFYATVFLLAMCLAKTKMLSTTLEESIAVKNELSLSDCALSSVLATTKSISAAVPSVLAAILQILIITFMNTITRRRSIITNVRYQNG